jgi:hypothetical protein
LDLSLLKRKMILKEKPTLNDQPECKECVECGIIRSILILN